MISCNDGYDEPITARRHDCHKRTVMANVTRHAAAAAPPPPSIPSPALRVMCDAASRDCCEEGAGGAGGRD